MTMTQKNMTINLKQPYESVASEDLSSKSHQEKQNKTKKTLKVTYAQVTQESAEKSSKNKTNNVITPSTLCSPVNLLTRQSSLRHFVERSQNGGIVCHLEGLDHWASTQRTSNCGGNRGQNGPGYCPSQYCRLSPQPYQLRRNITNGTFICSDIS